MHQSVSQRLPGGGVTCQSCGHWYMPDHGSKTKPTISKESERIIADFLKSKTK